MYGEKYLIQISPERGNGSDERETFNCNNTVVDEILVRATPDLSFLFNE